MFQLIKKNSGEGIVCDVRNDHVLVAVTRLCGDDDARVARSSPREKKLRVGCGNCGGCSSGGKNNSARNVKIYIAKNVTKKFTLGDHVSYTKYIFDPNLTSIIIFGVPIVFAFAAILLWIYNAPEQLESAAALATVIAAFFAGIIVIGIIDKIFKIKYPAQIVNTTRANNNIDTTDVNVNNTNTISINAAVSTIISTAEQK